MVQIKSTGNFTMKIFTANSKKTKINIKRRVMTRFLNRRNVLHKTCFEVKPSKLPTASSLNSTSKTTTTTLSSNLKKSATATTTITTTTRQTCFYLFSDDVKRLNRWWFIAARRHARNFYSGKRLCKFARFNFLLIFHSISRMFFLLSSLSRLLAAREAEKSIHFPFLQTHK